MTGAELIAAERKRQIEQEGWTAEHDKQHSPTSLKQAAHSYLLADGPDAELPAGWPWATKRWKPKDRKQNLIRAGALYLAAADRAQADRDRFGIWGISAVLLRGMADDCARLIDKLPTPNAEPRVRPLADGPA